MSWKEELIIGESPEKVTNIHSGNECELCPEAVAVYDFIKGLEAVIEGIENLPENVISNFREALNYFRETWPNEYYILLD